MLMSLAPDLIKLGEGEQLTSLSDLEQTNAVGESLSTKIRDTFQSAMPSCTTRSSSCCCCASTMNWLLGRASAAANAAARCTAPTTRANRGGVPSKVGPITLRG